MPRYGSTPTSQSEILTVYGDPNGGHDGPIGQLAVDVTEPDLYIKTTIAGTLTGWIVVGGVSAGPAGQQVYTNAGEPNGVVTHAATTPAMCIDTTNNVIWLKTDGVASSTGWAGS